MFKTLLTICISGLVGILLLAVIMPKEASVVADKVLMNIIGADTSAPIQLPSSEKTLQPESVIQDTKKTGDVPRTTKDAGPFSIENIVDATNKERIKAGLTPLKTNELLNVSAKVKTDDMIQNKYFEHVSPVNSKSVSDLGHEAGYDYILIGENLAVGNFSNADEILAAWMKSPGHRANILNTGYQEIGVYAGKGVYEGRNVWFAVQHFGTARGVCPSINESLKNNIDTINEKLKKEEAIIVDMRARIESPDHSTGKEYDDMVKTFNALVAQYNAQLADSQKKISTYNMQVKAFNACLSLYQK